MYPLNHTPLEMVVFVDVATWDHKAVIPKHCFSLAQFVGDFGLKIIVIRG